MTRILVVDDEPDIRKAMGILLKAEGFDVEFASNGEEAVSKVAEYMPDLVLLDMFMPKLSGRAACEKIRADARFKGVKVIFLTVAMFSGKGKDELSGLDISDYITKPFDNDDIVLRVKRALGMS